MAKLFPVYVYDSGITHYALASDAQLAARLPAELVTPDNWWHWRTVCGREIVAHVTVLNDTVNCQRCLAALDKARRTVAELRARFGDGLD